MMQVNQLIRYFGGIKLGIGGLIRAYRQTAKECFENAATVIYTSSVRLEIEMPYDHIGAILKLVARLKGSILGMEHGEKSKVVVRIRRSMVPLLEENIKAISGDIVVNNSK